MYIKYYESGLVPIPIKPGSKSPARQATGFHNWAHEGIPREIVEMFEKECPIEKGYGIGILCGAASNICVVDIDSDDPRILHACPISPIRRRGKKGEARFFQYNSELQNRNFFQVNEQNKRTDGIDILIERKYIIIPPSIHPDTGKAYVWLTPDDLLNFNAADLPNLTPEEVDQMGAVLGHDSSSLNSQKVDLSGIFESPDGRRAPHGSYNRIKALACGLIAKGAGIEEAIDALIKYDLDHHKTVQYFKDNRRHADFGADPYSNAVRMYGNILKTTNEQRLKKGFQPQLPKQKSAQIDISKLTVKIAENEDDHKDINFKAYPKPRGIMEKFVAYCELMGKGRQDALALGGALCFMSVLSANRFKSNVRGLDVWPNLYVLNLGYSAFGKDTAQKLLKDLLFKKNLIGATNYKSGTAMVKNLPTQQERLDVIDEATQLLDAMHSKEPYKKEMSDVLTQIFSSASNMYIGASSVEHGKNAGACWNPCVSVLASTTPAGFKGSVNQEMSAKGLLPRFITFFQKDIGSYKGQTNVNAAIELKKELSTFVDRITKMHKDLHKEFRPPVNYVAPVQTKQNEDVSMGMRYDPTLIPMSAKAHSLWLDFEEKCHTKSSKNPDGFESAFYGRFAELTAKVALLDRISQIPFCDPDYIPIFGGQAGIEIDEDNVLWSIELIKICWENSKPLYEVSNAETKHQSHSIRIMNLIKEAGGIMDQTLLCRKTQWLSKRERDGILESLSESASLVRRSGIPSKTGRVKIYWCLPDDLD